MSSRLDDNSEAKIDQLIQCEEGDFKAVLNKLQQPHYSGRNTKLNANRATSNGGTTLSSSNLHNGATSSTSSSKMSRASSMPADHNATTVAQLLTDTRNVIEREEDCIAAAGGNNFCNLIKPDTDDNTSQYVRRKPPSMLSKADRPTSYPHATQWGVSNGMVNGVGSSSSSANQRTIDSTASHVDDVINMFGGGANSSSARHRGSYDFDEPMDTGEQSMMMMQGRVERRPDYMTVDMSHLDGDHHDAEIGYIDDTDEPPPGRRPPNDEYHASMCFDYGGGTGSPEPGDKPSPFEPSNEYRRVNTAQRMAQEMQSMPRRGNPTSVMEPMNEAHSPSPMYFGNHPTVIRHLPFYRPSSDNEEESNRTPRELERRSHLRRKNDQHRLQRYMEQEVMDTVEGGMYSVTSMPGSRKQRKKRPSKPSSTKTAVELCEEAALGYHGLEDLDSVMAFIDGKAGAKAGSDAQKSAAKRQTATKSKVKKTKQTNGAKSGVNTASATGDDESSERKSVSTVDSEEEDVGGDDQSSDVADDRSTTTADDRRSPSTGGDTPIDWTDPKLYVNDDMDPCTLVASYAASDNGVAYPGVRPDDEFVAATHGRRGRKVANRPAINTAGPANNRPPNYLAPRHSLDNSSSSKRSSDGPTSPPTRNVAVGRFGGRHDVTNVLSDYLPDGMVGDRSIRRPTTEANARTPPEIVTVYNSEDHVDPPLTLQNDEDVILHASSTLPGGRSWAHVAATISPRGGGGTAVESNSTASAPLSPSTTNETMELPSRPLRTVEDDAPVDQSVDSTSSSTVTATESVLTVIDTTVHEEEEEEAVVEAVVEQREETKTPTPPAVAIVTEQLSSVTIVETTTTSKDDAPTSLLSPNAVLFTDETTVGAELDVSFTWDETIPPLVEEGEEEDVMEESNIVMRCKLAEGEGEERIIDMLVGNANNSITRSASLDTSRNIVPPSAAHLKAARLMNRQFAMFMKNKPTIYGQLMTGSALNGVASPPKAASVGGGNGKKSTKRAARQNQNRRQH